MKILRKVYESNYNNCGASTIGGEKDSDLDLELGINVPDVIGINVPDFFDLCDFSSGDKVSEEKVVHPIEFRQDCVSFGFDSESVSFLSNIFSTTTTSEYSESMGKYQSDSLHTPSGSPVRTGSPVESEPVDFELDQLMGDVYEYRAEVSPEKDCFLPVCLKEEGDEEIKVGSSSDRNVDQQILIPDNSALKEPTSSAVDSSELDDYIKNNIEKFSVEDMITDDFYEEVNYNNNNFPDDCDLFATLVSHDTASIIEAEKQLENNCNTTTTTPPTNTPPTIENVVPEKKQEPIVQVNTNSNEIKSPKAINSPAKKTATTPATKNDRIVSSVLKYSAPELQPRVVLKRISKHEIDKALSIRVNKKYKHQNFDTVNKSKVLSTPTAPKKGRGRPKKVTPSTITSNNNNNTSKNRKRKREKSESENNTDNSVQEIEYKNQTPIIPTTKMNTRLNPKSEPNRTFGTESEEKNGRVHGRRRCYTVAPTSSSSVEAVQEMVDKRFKSREAETPRSSLDTTTRNGSHRYGLRNRN